MEGASGLRWILHLCTSASKSDIFRHLWWLVYTFDSVITSIGKVVALSKCVRVEIGWRQKSPTAVTASLETRPTMDVEPER